MRNQVIATFAMAMLGACVGGIDNGTMTGGDDDGSNMGSGTGNAKAMFDSQIAPLLTANCASCHVGPETSTTNPFLGNSGVAGYYAAITADRAVNGGFDPAAALLLSQGAHQGPAWMDADKAKITAWLQAEVTARGIMTTPGSGTTVNLHSALGAEQAFAGCMQAPASMTDYTTLKPYQVGNMTTSQGKCTSCHNSGAGGEYFNPNNTYLDMYGKWQQQVFFTGVFVANPQADNSYKIGPAQDKICAKGKEQENSMGEHPTFDCQQNGGTALKALTDYTTAVMARVTAADPTCLAPAFVAPTTP